jgi:hypothetical protein
MSAVDFVPLSAQRSPRSRTATRELWRDRLARFPSSSLTVAQFCAIEACSVPSFYSWKRRFAADDLDNATPHHRNADGGARLPPALGVNHFVGRLKKHAPRSRSLRAWGPGHAAKQGRRHSGTIATLGVRVARVPLTRCGSARLGLAPP